MYLQLATFSDNKFNTPRLRNYSQYKVVFDKEPKSLLNLESMPNIKISGTFKDY